MSQLRLRGKIILIGMVMRGLVSFGLAFYTIVNFARWFVQESNNENQEEMKFV